MQVRTSSGFKPTASSSTASSNSSALRHIGSTLFVAVAAFGSTFAAVFLLFYNQGKPLPDAVEFAGGWGLVLSVIIVVTHIVDCVRRARIEAAGGGPGIWQVTDYLVIILFFVAIFSIWFAINWLRAEPEQLAQPAAPKSVEYSFGPQDAIDVELTTAGGVTVELLPSVKSLGARRFEQFDLTPAGSIIVLDEGQLYDLMTGEGLLDQSVEVRGAAFSGGSIAIATGQGALGYDNGSGFSRVSDAPWVSTGLAPTASRSALFLYRQSDDGGSGGAAIIALASGGQPQLVARTTRAVRAVGGEPDQAYFSDGSRLYRAAAGEQELVLALPDGQPILGIATGGDGVYFATQRGVYVLDGPIALPLVLGIGGPLRVYGQDLYVLAYRHGRIFRVDLSGQEKQ